MYVFKDIYNLGEPYNNIHPYKQSEVYNIVKSVPENVRMIIIFGSAATDCCHSYSDTDIFVLYEKDTDYNRWFDCENGCDIVKYDDVKDFIINAAKTDSLEYNIVKEGVCVYVKI